MDELRLYTSTNPAEQVKEQNTFTDSIKKSSAKKTSNQPKLRFAGFSKDWNKTKLGDLVSITTGKVNLDEADENGKYNFYTCGIKVLKTNSYAFEGPAITIAGNGSIGFMQLVDGKFNAYQRTYVLQNFKADRSFIFNVIKKPLDKKIKMESRGGVIPYIVLDMLTDLHFHLPEEIEQQKIGNFFKDLDKLIQMSKVLKENYSILKEYLLRQLIPSTRNPIPRLRFASFDSPWDVITFEKIGSVKSCKRVLIEQTTPEGDIPFYKIGTFGGQADAYITRELFETYKSKYPYPKKGDVMMSAIGTIGKSIVYNGEEAYYKDSNIIWLTNDKGIDSKFLQILLSIVNWGAEGSTLRKISSKDILNMLTVLPSKEEQIKVSNLITDVENHIKELSSKISSLERFKQALLQRMFV
ncbi:hypothetical protein CJP74_01300 [Psittacicella melopsittaci]|uniref:Type I restriction modification DNA specificity domain-containing protein n=1 Tax=Psittacicella melopsittaci TaxID=2028576 RepID=A0A3A1Y5X1_9GAMM|nr:restriction endonuclease subunit S [Psittacicella melopsittaci]RIY33653.1 hypothetical protein CJP74_01300 [Psittacicella melopsittaci]